MKRKNKENNLGYFVVVIVSISLIIVLSFFLFKNNYYLDKQTISTSFIYSDTTGFELGTGNLDFGALVSNQKASRSVSISNDYDFPINIHMRVSGEIKDFIIVEENNLVLYPGEVRELIFTVNPGTNLTEYRRYSGEIIVITRKDKS